MRALLFVDMLGVKSRWLSGGRGAAEYAFTAFRDFLSDAISSVPQKDLLTGLIESDSAALACRSPKVAITLGTHLYLKVFMSGVRTDKDRFWLRGVIAPHRDNDALRSEAGFSVGEGISVFSYSDPLLDAIAAEKSGVKGMRLLIAAPLASKSVSRSVRLKVGEEWFSPLQRLSHSSQPTKIFDEYRDVLWMATGDEKEWQKRKRAMATRLRCSAKSPEEFLQAGITQVVFHECNAMLGKLASKTSTSSEAAS